MRQKIDTEVIEIDRLHEEIAEYEELRSITTLGVLELYYVDLLYSCSTRSGQWPGMYCVRVIAGLNHHLVCFTLAVEYYPI